MIRYITYSIAVTIISWIIGMIVNAFIMKTAFYKNHLSNLNIMKSESVNKRIGIGIFKWIVKSTFFKFLNPKLKLKRKIEISELNTLRNEMTIAEISHLIGFGFVTVFAAMKTFNGNYLFGLIIMLVNILMNLYPSLLQQENKRRIDHFLNKLQRT